MTPMKKTKKTQFDGHHFSDFSVHVREALAECEDEEEKQRELAQRNIIEIGQDK